MQFTGIKKYLGSIFNLNLKPAEVALSWRHHEVESEDERKKIFLRPEMNLREVTMKYGRLVVFIRHESA
jgi:hypothetical protein